MAAPKAQKRLGDLRADALDLNDLAELEDAFGDLDEIQWSNLKVVRMVLWLYHRKTEPSITEVEVGAKYNVSNLREAVSKLLAASGITAQETNPGEAPPAKAG
jgi:hypothetical protein